jgi:hypothetical protein
VNYPGNDAQFDAMQMMIEYLLNLGITTEPLPSQAAAKGAASASASASPPQAEYRFCFAPHDRQMYRAQITDLSALCGYEKPKTKTPPALATTTTKVDKTTTTTDEKAGTKTVTVESGGSVTTAPKDAASASPDQTGGKKRVVAGLALTSEFMEKVAPLINPSRPKGPVRKGVHKTVAVTLSIYTRSTEGVLYFLGEVVRGELYPDRHIQPGKPPRTIQIKIETSPHPKYPLQPCDPNGAPLPGQGDQETVGDFACQNLFVLDAAPGLVGSGVVSVSYNGMQYSVPSDVDRAGKTMHVLSIVKQLLAVNMSAKSLPQTSIISVISP